MEALSAFGLSHVFVGRPTVLLSAFVCAALLSNGAAGAETDGLIEPVRKLNSLQNAMARGVATARASIPAQVERIERAISTLEADAWKERGNARAAATFLLCGGSPRLVRRIADAHLFAETETPLIEAVLAYAEGRSRDATQLLAPIDPKTQPATLGGHLALVRGGLLIGADDARARELFDLARLLVPSSLVEEAALRRELSIVDPLQETDKTLLLARRYVSQYSKSPFARNFWNEFRAVTLRVASHMTEDRLAEFLAPFDVTPAAVRFEVRMAIAQEAILHGRSKLAAEQTERAASLADVGAGKARVALYRAALMALDGEFREAAARIAEIDAKSLTPRDRELREIVSGVMERLQVEPDSAVVAALSPREESTIEREARRALADSETVLRRARER
jgi:chemotaxis protein MotC